METLCPRRLYKVLKMKLLKLAKVYTLAKRGGLDSYPSNSSPLKPRDKDNSSI